MTFEENSNKDMTATNSGRDFLGDATTNNDCIQVVAA